MSDLDKFNDEEKKHLSYLGSMLRRPPKSEFDQEVQAIFDAEHEARSQGPEQQEKEISLEETGG